MRKILISIILLLLPILIKAKECKDLFEKKNKSYNSESFELKYGEGVFDSFYLMVSTTFDSSDEVQITIMTFGDIKTKSGKIKFLFKNNKFVTIDTEMMPKDGNGFSVFLEYNKFIEKFKKNLLESSISKIELISENKVKPYVSFKLTKTESIKISKTFNCLILQD